MVCSDHVGFNKAQGGFHTIPIIHGYQVHDDEMSTDSRRTKLWRRWRFRSPCVVGLEDDAGDAVALKH